jgi:hypothetical protein
VNGRPGALHLALQGILSPAFSDTAGTSWPVRMKIHPQQREERLCFFVDHPRPIEQRRSVFASRDVDL